MTFLLYPFSLIYRAVCWLKSLSYQTKFIQAKKAPLRVISVGNISFGGSEKTPMAMSLISALLEHGYKPALVSRGYGGRWEKQGGILSDGQNVCGDWQDAGDEPFMVAQSLKQSGIFIGKDRLSSCQKAKESGFNLAVLDDGFQHLRLHRDIDIVMFSPQERIVLRESVSALKRSDFILVKDEVNALAREKLKNRFPQSSLFCYSVTSKGLFPLGGDRPIPHEAVKNRKILAFCGIASPQRFTALLKANGIFPHTFLTFKDHHPYPPSSLDRIKRAYADTGAEAAITTEKDAVKITGREDLDGVSLYCMKIGLEIETDFYTQLLSLLKNKDQRVP